MDPGRRLSTAPPPLLNYGRYTGAPIIGATPAIPPTPEAYAEDLVANGAPLRAALSHMGGGVRPGNNDPNLVGHEQCVPGNHALVCLKKMPRREPPRPPRPANSSSQSPTPILRSSHP